MTIFSRLAEDLSRFVKDLSRFTKDESGAIVIEYSVIAALMAAAIIAAVFSFNTDLTTAFTNMSATLKNNTK